MNDYPFSVIRPGVEEALDKIRKAVDDGKRFILLHGPTGCGKSFIAAWWARKYKSVIITPTKLLQEQYANTKEFDKEYVVFGKANYNCGLKGFTNLRVDEAICCSDSVVLGNIEYTNWANDISITENEHPAKVLKQKCAQTGICEYYSKLYKIGKEQGAVINYDLLTHIKHKIEMGRYVALDEAHTLADKARNVYGYVLAYTYAEHLLGDSSNRKTNESPVTWLRRLSTICAKELEKEKEHDRGSALKRFQVKLTSLLDMDIGNPAMFYIEEDDKEIRVRPLDLRMFKNDIFSPFAHILLLSATFPKNFCDILDIKEHEKVEVKIPSTFDKAKRPVVYIKNSQVLNYATVLTKEHGAIVALDKILIKHKSHKGAIHSVSYKIFEQLKAIYKYNDRFIWIGRGEDKAFHLRRHTDSDKPTILVSPSIMEGLDLKDDLARFQVMVKLPFPALDEYMKRLKSIYKSFYENETITKIVQAYGRAVRTHEDYAAFYILDGSFARMLSQHRHLFPTYFLEALHFAQFNSKE